MKTQLTVLMTVYNGEEYLTETVESVLNQTYRDFKFLVIDNASTDNSQEIIQSFNDPRIQLEVLPQNIGQVAALNKGLEMINTPLVARIDADDICLPQRFERQVAFMELHPDIGVCGTFVTVFQQENGIETKYRWPTQSEDIKVKLLFECCMPHPGVMIRKSLFDQCHLRYDENIGHSFDWDLWERGSEFFELSNIPEFHLRYRLHPENESKKTLHLQEQAAKKIDHRSLSRLGLQDHPLKQIHRDVAFETFHAANRGPDFLKQVLQWFYLLESANMKKSFYSPKALNRFLKERLFMILNVNLKFPGIIIKIFFKEQLYLRVGFFKSMKFFFKILLSLILRRGAIMLT